MAQELSIATQKRITFLSLFETLGGDYDATINTLQNLEEDGRFFDSFEVGSNPSSSRPSGNSARPASRSQSGSGGNSRPRGRDGGGFSGNMRDPDGPPSDKQVATVLKNTDDYTESELFDMTKQEVSNIIDDLFSKR